LLAIGLLREGRKKEGKRGISPAFLGEKEEGEAGDLAS